MVYSQPQSPTNEMDLSIQGVVGGITNNPPVKILYNGSGIHDITGPVPMISFSTTPNTNDNGFIYSTTSHINLAGTIYIPTGISGVLNAVSGLKKLFFGSSTPSEGATSDNYNNVLKIQCDNADTFVASGVRATSFSVEKSSNNWVMSADYSIDLEYISPISTKQNKQYFVKTASDSWSIEPLEDYVFTYGRHEVHPGKGEYHNPNSGFTTTNAENTYDLYYKGIPQYKVSRKLSAVGFSSSTSANAGIGSEKSNLAYLNAKLWVTDKLQSALAATSTYGFEFATPYLKDTKYFYNHLRSINFSVTDGTYEVNDSWLSMPTGISYVEDYTIECATDEKYLKTIRVAGQIKGLSRVADLELQGKYLNPDYAGDSSTGATSGLISNRATIAISGSSFNSLIDETQDIHYRDNNTASTVTQITQSKYLNAQSGWLNDIKPFLYSRACLGIKSADRNVDYIQANVVPQPPPNNPIYSYERLLNVIPVSTAEGYDPRKGTISYSYEYTNKFNYFSGVIAENISMTDNNPTDVVSEVFVLGRRLGPVIQNLGARTTAKRELTVDVVVLPPSALAGFVMTNTACPLYTGGTIYTAIDTLVKQLKPFGDRPVAVFGNTGTRLNTVNDTGQVFIAGDTTSWNPVNGTFSRSVSWIYQQCTNTRSSTDI